MELVLDGPTFNFSDEATPCLPENNKMILRESRIFIINILFKHFPIKTSSIATKYTKLCKI